MSERPDQKGRSAGLEEDSFSIRPYLALLAAQKAFIIVFCFSTMFTSLVLTYVASEKYESATTIVYRPQEVTRLRFQEKQTFGAPSPSPPFEVIKDNLEELVKSETILREVVLELGLHEEVPKNYDLYPWYLGYFLQTKDTVKQFVYDSWEFVKYGRLIEEEPVAATIKGLRKNVFLVDQTSYVFYLVVRDNYPKRAGLIVDAIASRLVDYLRAEQRKAGQAKQDQLELLLQTKRAEIDTYRRQIEKLQQDNDVLSPSLEAEQTMSRWSELELTRVQLEAQITQTRARLEDVERYYRGNTARPGARLEAEDGDDIPEAGRLIQPSDFRRLESERLFQEIELSGLTAKYESVSEAIAAVEEKRQVLPGLEKSLSALETKLEIAKRDLVQFTDAYQEAVVQATAAESEAEVLHPATLPSAPVAPIKVYHVGLAGFLAFVIAVGLIYLLTFAEIYILFPPKPMVELGRSL